MAQKTNNLVACAECDALQREVAVSPRVAAHCIRCDAVLYRERPESLDHTLAFLLAATVLFIFANAYPLIGLDARGIRTSATLLDTALALYEQNMVSVAMLVFATVIGFPGVMLAAMLYMLAPLRLGVVPQHLHTAYRIFAFCQAWAMVEVFLLGCLVSLVKLTQVAQIEAFLGIYAVAGYVLLIAAAQSTFEPREFWKRAAELGAPLPARLEQAP